MSELILLGTDGCHLCEEAEYVLAEVGLLEHVKKQDIADSEQMVSTYGTRIPVLLDSATGDTLDWPFNRTSIINWLDD
ncbi:glutaredoxin family protein [Gayadomonas joobiniege]|uniref:glutaredoxin family protein n=1 Tax=Gayadomonas joobiniege TaxID=1234606 RepID=UPI0003602F47|nr:glutaredoxin family protein [Gayadomonas joobiniege]